MHDIFSRCLSLNARIKNERRFRRNALAFKKPFYTFPTKIRSMRVNYKPTEVRLERDEEEKTTVLNRVA